MRDRILIVDGNNTAHRFAHVPAELAPAERFGAYLGRLLKDEQPTHAVVVFDPIDGGSNWRREKWPAYKAGRTHDPAIDEVLAGCRQQVRYWRTALAVVDGHEADDVIASYVAEAKTEGFDVTIVSGDKDLLQLVRGPFPRYWPFDSWATVQMRDDVRGRRWGTGEVIEHFGVWPRQMADYLALVGDATDGIPGVPGVGPKTAARLLLPSSGEVKDLDAVLRDAPLIRSTALMRKLLDHREDALLFRELVTLRRDLELPVPIAETRLQRSARA